jgi:Amt family ammonium transporter
MHIRLVRPGRAVHGEAYVSRGQKFVAVTVLTFIALIIAGAMWGHHAPADPTGPAFNSLGNYPKTTTNVPVSQDGLNALASDTAHVGVSVNFTWTLVTGFLVLFMQVGFAFLVTPA